MFDDPAFYQLWLEECSDIELAHLYKEWVEDGTLHLPNNISLIDECWRRGMDLSALEQLLQAEEEPFA